MLNSNKTNGEIHNNNNGYHKKSFTYNDESSKSIQSGTVTETSNEELRNKKKRNRFRNKQYKRSSQSNQQPDQPQNKANEARISKREDEKVEEQQQTQQPSPMFETSTQTNPISTINSNPTIHTNSLIKSSTQKDLKANSPTTPRLQQPPIINESQNEVLPHQAYKSPRKEAILRHKQSNGSKESKNNQSNYRENLKSNKDIPSPKSLVHYGNQHHDTAQDPSMNLKLDEKVTLFKYRSSKILELVHKNDINGSLLAHGEFEIFQLHNGDITYLSCGGGKSFIYPLLPKIKISRIEFNKFIIHLINPKRFWKIFINSDEKNVIEILQGTLERNVKYENEYKFDSEEDEKQNSVSNKIEENRTPEEDEEQSIYKRLDMKPRELMEDSPQNLDFKTSSNNFIDNIIPDSPPSAPISPTQDIIKTFDLDPVRKEQPQYVHPYYSPTSFNQPSKLKKHSSLQSMNTNVACLDVGPKTPNQHIIKSSIPVHQQLQNPYQAGINNRPNHNHSHNHNHNHNHNHSHIPHQFKNNFIPIDEKSESSMDSLLDEFEESLTKSVKQNIVGGATSTIYSRPPSIIQHSVTSQHNPIPLYSRGKYFDGKIENDEECDENYNQKNKDKQEEITSLNDGFNKSHSYRYHPNEGLHSSRSRRSSRSDLYTNESGWMEPNIKSKLIPTNANHNHQSINGSVYSRSKLPKSRSNQSISSSVSHNQYNNLSNIYRSVIGQKLHDNGNIQNDYTSVSSVRSMSRLPPRINPQHQNQIDLNLRRQSSYLNSKPNINQSNNPSEKIPIKTNANSKNLNSKEIYQILSSTSAQDLKRNKNSLPQNQNNQKKPIPKSTSFTSRLFGW
ncbi:INP1 [Candida pseudojiufengensis]|uniref:INP1 n=1 Tax=Candida pseudojiufengensis TaxID=497109 RepID=UPI0022252367|nr:INP1 [Candida pseudojiufengensis]KAI5959774.1 INP1 [Candida pseudojiufengensis]